MKNKKLKLHILITALALVMIVTGCSSNNCRMDTKVTCNLFLVNYDFSDGGDGIILVKLNAGDTTFIASSNPIKVPLTLNNVNKITFSYANKLDEDEFTIESEPYTHVDYPECGCYSFHIIKKCTINNFSNIGSNDSIKIINPLVNYDNQQNIKIHYGTK